MCNNESCQLIQSIIFLIKHFVSDEVVARHLISDIKLINLNSQWLFTPAELLGSDFCSQLFASSEVSQLGFLVSIKTVICYSELSFTQFTILNAFSPIQGLLCGIFVQSCSPLSRLLSWLFAFPWKRYLANFRTQISILNVFCPDKGYFTEGFVSQLFAQTRVNQLAVRFPLGIAT